MFVSILLKLREGFRGPSAEDYYMSPGFPEVVSTDWKAGSVVEAAWAVRQNQSSVH